jgi:hypothetical protein
MNVTPILQLIIAAGLLNVWLLRYQKATSYRGGNAKNLKDEFAVYGLAPWVHYVVGTLKVLSAFALVAGLWIPTLALGASLVVASLMLGAIAMHLKVRDPAIRFLPAALMFGMSLAVAMTSSIS